MSLVVLLLKNHHPVVKLGAGYSGTSEMGAVNCPGNPHRQSEFKTAPDCYFEQLSLVLLRTENSCTRMFSTLFAGPTHEPIIDVVRQF